MNRPVVILVMCGSSIVTSNLAAVKLKDEARRREVKIICKKGKVADANTLIEKFHPDFIVATAHIPPREDILVFNGVPLISGNSKKKFYDDIFDAISKMED